MKDGGSQLPTRLQQRLHERSHVRRLYTQVAHGGQQKRTTPACVEASVLAGQTDAKDVSTLPTERTPKF